MIRYSDLWEILSWEILPKFSERANCSKVWCSGSIEGKGTRKDLMHCASCRCVYFRCARKGEWRLSPQLLWMLSQPHPTIHSEVCTLASVEWGTDSARVASHGYFDISEIESCFVSTAIVMQLCVVFVAVFCLHWPYASLCHHSQ